MKESIKENKISRKEAMKELGKYAALTALGTFMILNPQKAQAGSTPPDAGGDPLSSRKQTKQFYFPGRSPGKNK